MTRDAMTESALFGIALIGVAFVSVAFVSAAIPVLLGAGGVLLLGARMVPRWRLRHMALRRLRAPHAALVAIDVARGQVVRHLSGLITHVRSSVSRRHHVEQSRDERCADVLDSVARELRLGASLHAAVVSAIERHQFDEWQWLAQAARRGDPLTTIGADDLATRAISLAAEGCDAVCATESAARTLRANAAIAADSHAAVAHTRASMNVLAAVPLIIAAWLVVRDGGAREFFASPPGVGCVVGGVALHWLGRCWVARLAREARRTEAAVPDFVDLLALQVRSGRPPALAFLRASDSATGGLGEATRSVATVVRDGARFVEALTGARTRFDVRANGVIDALIDTERDGLAPRAIFERLSHDAHQQRRREADARIRALPVRLTLPLVTCILPAYVLLAVIPLLASQFPSVVIDPQ